MKGKISPCDAIFQQASVGLTAKIHLLKVEGEVQLGRDSVSELDERAQMTALDLKTCCTVLDAGRLDSEQFLQCKAKARTYDARIEDISALVHTAVHEQGLTAVDVLQSNAPIQNAIETARSTIKLRCQRCARRGQRRLDEPPLMVKGSVRPELLGEFSEVSTHRSL